MIGLLLLALVRPLLRWVALLALLVAADAVLGGMLRQLQATCFDPYLPRAVTSGLRLVLLAAGGFLALAARARWRSARRLGR
jgi:hypothetical protein